MARLTPDALVYDLVSAGDAQVSPDGTRVVYSVGRADRERDHGTSQLWLSDIDGANARRLTWTGDRNREPRWSPDGRWIAFVSCEVEFVRYPGGSHAMLRVGPPSHRADFLGRLLGWFTDHLALGQNLRVEARAEASVASD